MRCSGSIVSTVAIKLAKGPVSISTLSPQLRLFGGSNAPDASHLSIETRDKLKGKWLWFAVKADKSRNTNRVVDCAPWG